MHTDGNARFEEEFDVSYVISRPSHSITFFIINAQHHMQSLSLIPKSSNDVSKQHYNCKKNRFNNIFPCELK